MKKSLRIILSHLLPIAGSLLLSVSCFAQAGEWTWMKGSTGGGSVGSFGTQGTASPTNTPPGLYEAQSWTDAEFNFWLFGGVAGSTYGDLWKYDVASGNWTWMKGTGNPASTGVYGTMGVPAPTNRPGSRGYGSVGWVDDSSHLWLFAGWGYDVFGSYGPLSDLWKYDPITNEWTWMQGSNQSNANPVFGVNGVPAAGNTPGNRYEFNAAWKAADGTFWLYGGETSGGFTLNRSDMWKYDPVINQWAWMQGDGPGANYVNPVYGTLGIADSLNTPGSRSCYSVTTDKNGKFWMFGGYQQFASPVYNDVWMFDPDSLLWTWMGGTNIMNNQGIYTQTCDTQTANIPKSRLENRSDWSDACGNLWTFGGEIQNTSGAPHDLWVFETISKKWKWIKGNSNINANGNYGTILVSSPTNDPGGRSGQVTWTDSSGALWLFGGFDGNYNTKNDLWRFVIDTACVNLSNCAIQSISFGASDPQICQKFCINFFDSSSNNPTSWLWEFPGGSPSTSTDQNPATVCYNNPGIYDVTLITTNASGSDTLTLPGYITVFATPSIPVITQTGYTLTSTLAATYQWEFNNVTIPGATNQSYEVTQTGYYTVFITDENGCTASTTLYVLITGMGEVFSESSLLIYPNPSNGSFIVEWPNGLMAGDILINVMNTLGEVIFSSEENIATSSHRKEIDLTARPAGIYFIEIKGSGHFRSRAIIVMK